MTDEQIKQNTEEYANDEKQYYLGIGCYDLICEAYIAGAHSRDEEIKELQEDLESLQEQYDSLFDGFSKRGTKLGALMRENVKLRNHG